MASQSKKTATKKKIPAKRRRTKRRRGKSNVKKNIFLVIGFFFIISMVFFGYFLEVNDKINYEVVSSQINKNKETYTTKQLLDDLSKIKIKKPKEKEKLNPEIVIKVEKKRVSKPLITEKKEEIKIEKEKRKKKDIVLAYRGKKPKLVIIIDDISSRKQLKHIKSLPLKVTPSIFPPYKLSKSNHKLAQNLKYYMIHLPMESGKVFDKQHGTLKVTDSKEKIEARVKELRELFPKARYINNHTGSVFTRNYKAMHILYAALRKEGFIFIDSRTTGSSKVRKIAHSFGDAYVGRDIFIDNIHTISYIHKQLRKAVRIAKKKGYAIVIGHPHSVTMKALGSAKNIFKDIEIVYIDDIFR